MPSIAHLVLGGIIGMCLYYMSDGKFTKTHVFIFFMNNYLGPDVGWALGVGTYTHTLLGWFFFAFLLAVFYHYFTRFTIKVNGFKDIEIVDTEHYRLSYLNVYCLVLAGGILHLYLDSTMNSAGVFNLLPEIPGISKSLSWTLPDFIGFWYEGTIDFNPILALIIGVAFILGFIFVFVWFLKTNTLKSGLITLCYIGLFMFFFLLAGHYSTAHADSGAILYVSIYWITPFVLCTLSTRSYLSFKEKESKPKNIEKRTGISIGKILLLLIGIFTILEGLFLFFIKDSIAEILLERDIIDFAEKYKVLNAITIISIIIGGFGCLEIFLWIYCNKIDIHHKNLLIISLWLFISGIIGISLSIAGIILYDEIVSYIFFVYSPQIAEYLSYDEGLLILLMIAAILLTISIINVICAIGLIIKNRIIWKISIYYHLVLAWTIIGLTIACALSENSVKKIMKRDEKY
ncbi:MAG: hypothetical protein ACTSQJ_15930 [Promethearchaeota archaeon]